MVNGKPTLVFGDDSRMASLQPKGRATARNAVRSPLGGAPEFASFLPGNGKSQAVGAPGAAAPVAFTTQGVHADLTAALRQGAGMGKNGPDGAFLGSDATVALNAVKSSPSAHAEGRRTSAAGGQSRAQAAVQAQTAMQARGVTTSKRPTRVTSGNPITGRNAIGMEDTRRNRASSAGGSTLARHEGFSAPTAAALQAQGAFGAQGAPGQTASAQGGGFLFQGIGGMGLSAQAGASSFQGSSFGYGSPAQGDYRNMGALAKALESSSTPLKTLNSLPGGLAFGAARGVQFAGGEEGAVMSVRTASHKGGERLAAMQPAGDSGRSLVRAFQSMGAGQAMMVGTLAAKFESGSEGIAAIGYDRHGGTSYGKFQLSSRAGTMGNFINYLEEKAPDMAKKLAAAGSSNTGRRTGKMPEAWKELAAAEPQRFEELQDDFIRKSHFEPAMQNIAESTGIAFEKMPAALQEVVFSTAVQHGPSGAARIIAKAVDRVGAGKLQTAQASPENIKRAGRDLIKQIYSIRAGQFVSSTERVQAAAKSRLNNEMHEALNMLA